MNPVYTVGHSTHPAERFRALLAAHRITTVADVRSQPWSRFNPQFNRETLRAFLQSTGITYRFLGQELGARTEDPACYVEGRVDYDRLARTARFREGIEEVARLAATERVALLCAEKEPLSCHRTLLVSRHVVERGLDVQHILADASLERHDDTMTRLIEDLGLGADLFRDRAELVAEAYARRGREIAYTRKEVP